MATSRSILSRLKTAAQGAANSVATAAYDASDAAVNFYLRHTGYVSSGMSAAQVQALPQQPVGLGRVLLEETAGAAIDLVGAATNVSQYKFVAIEVYDNVTGRVVEAAVAYHVADFLVAGKLVPAVVGLLDNPPHASGLPTNGTAYNVSAAAAPYKCQGNEKSFSMAVVPVIKAAANTTASWVLSLNASDATAYQQHGKTVCNKVTNERIWDFVKSPGGIATCVAMGSLLTTAAGCLLFRPKCITQQGKPDPAKGKTNVKRGAGEGDNLTSPLLVDTGASLNRNPSGSDDSANGVMVGGNAPLATTPRGSR